MTWIKREVVTRYIMVAAASSPAEFIREPLQPRCKLILVRFHMLFLDGVYFDDANASSIRFRWVRAPTSAELTQLTHTIAQRVGRFLKRQGLRRRDTENGYLSGETIEAGYDQVARATALCLRPSL